MKKLSAVNYYAPDGIRYTMRENVMLTPQHPVCKMGCMGPLYEIDTIYEIYTQTPHGVETQYTDIVLKRPWQGAEIYPWEWAYGDKIYHPWIYTGLTSGELHSSYTPYTPSGVTYYPAIESLSHCL